MGLGHNLQWHKLLHLYWSVILLGILFRERESHVFLVSPNILPLHLSFSRAMIIRCWRQHITFCLRQIHKCLQLCCRAEVEYNHMCHKNSSFHSHTRELFRPRLNLSIFLEKLALMYRELQSENCYVVNVRKHVRMLCLHVDISNWATHSNSFTSSGEKVGTFGQY